MNQIKARWSNNFHQLQVGINQGCNLSTILYCGFSNQIMEKTQAAKDQNGNSYKFALGFIDDMVVITTPDKIQQTINETIALYKEMHLEVNTEKCECTHPNFFNKSGIVNFLGQDFGKTAKPLAKQITDNLKKKFDGYAKLDIPNKDKLLLFCQCIVSACNYGPLIDVAEHCAENKQLYQEIDKQLMVDMEEILHSNASSDALQQFAFDFKCQGGLGIILPGAYYDQMKVDQIQKIDYYIRENGDLITKSKLEQIIGKINTKMTKSKNFFRDTRKEMKIQEKMSLQVDDTVPKPGYTLLGRRRMDNTAFQYMINWVFNNVRDTPIPEICELCKKPYKEGHEQDCKKINELNIAAHDRFANFLERILRKRYQARKVCKDNDNRLEDRTKPDISIVVNGVQIYLDIGITWDLDKYYALKEQHYRDKKDQNGNPLKIIPIIIGKNLTIHQKSREFLEELRVNFETIYEDIGYMISTSQTHRAELMYRKKVVQRGEKHSEIDVEKPSANRFASLADSDVQFKRTDNYRKIFDYLHEKGMMKVATQSPIKEVPAKPKQTLKNFEKAHKTKTKKKSTQTAEKGNNKLEDTSTKKKPDQPTQTKVIPNAKGNDKKIQSLKEKIAKLQRELQSQFDTAAAVMRKFKETKKKHDDKKITQKTSNAEAQSENEKKTKVSQKAEPTKNIEEKAPDKTKPKDAQKQKEKKPPVQKSQDQKTTIKPQSSSKSPQKETQKKKEDKQPVLEKPVKSQPKDGPNEQNTIADAKQETKPFLTKAQKKKLQMEYQKQFIQKQRAKEDTNAPKPQEKVNLPPAIYPEIRNLQKQINQEGTQAPNQVDETMHQRQPPPSNANTTEQPLVQAEGNNEQKGTEKRETVSKKQVSESAETGPQQLGKIQTARITKIYIPLTQLSFILDQYRVLNL
ncbi:Reverse_transcriptase (RNA-dependent DNA polymerase) [Hexamita inflata]|uniref:Reverse transcriptase (RNA-dependent DNA polymerase) n=1 Tax=Hexamita inflata TaxID=28002 RepID=A0AA86UWQ1_9EUKA|nr:Reverse transcriptase (RNA-dependent DNA polymerase) [Hexamita inflata]